MKKAKSRRPRHEGNDDLRVEYRFDYAQSRANRFATRMDGPTVAVVLEPDVARVFGSAEVVNQLLRSIISAMPERTRKGLRRKAS